MAALKRLRNNNWKEDVSLKEAFNEFVRQGLCRNEILDYMARDFPNYTWSVRTLDRRLRYFEIYYTHIDVTVEQDEQVVWEELKVLERCLDIEPCKKILGKFMTYEYLKT
jgi:hypothetical protein